MRKLIDGGKKFWQQHFHQIAPAVKLTSKCAEYLAEFNQLLKTPTIPNYINVGFKIKSAYNDAFKDSQHFFLTPGWKRFGSQDLELMIPQLALEFYPQKIRIVGSENQTSKIHIVDLGEAKFGWYGSFDHVEACYCFGDKNKLYNLIAGKVWEEKSCIAINLKTKGYYNYFVMEEEKLHENFAIGSQAQKYYEYIKEYRDRKMGKSFLFYGAPGCHRKGQHIIMYDGSLKAVENIRKGDLLMGPDSTPRKVSSLCRGTGEMVKIIPVKGKSFVVNIDHILTLVHSGKNKIIDISVRDWFNLGKYDKQRYKLFRADDINFKSKDKLSLDPRFLGILLGDGCLLGTPNVTTKDKEILKYLKCMAPEFETNLTKTIKKDSEAATYNFSSKYYGKWNNKLREELRNLGLFGHKSDSKFIPHKYKISSIHDRLELLAGLIDTDGSFIDNCFDFLSKSETLANDVVFVAKSVGLAAYTNKCIKADQNGTKGEYHRVYISGNTDKIKTLLKYKQATKRKQIKNVLRTGFKVEKLSSENYYGFTLDKDQRYLLDDFTVTHNTGKSFCIKGIVHLLKMKTLRIQQLNKMNNSSIVELIDMFSPDAIVLEDIDHLYSHDISTLLEKIENFNTTGKYIFATANEINLVHDALLRPGRFDELIELPLDYEMVRKEIPDVEIYEMVKEFPIAFVMEVKKRLEVKGKERFLKEGIEDIIARVNKIKAGNFKLENKAEPEAATPPKSVSLGK